MKIPLFQRHLEARLAAALEDTPVVLLVGARQTGKTTLCRAAAAERGARLLSLDDAATLAAAAADPSGFIAAHDAPVFIDEVQKVPALLPAIKLAVDRRREPGRFLLTGSANVLVLPRVSESLAGRMEVLTLHPLSQGELLGHQEKFIDSVFGAERSQMAGAASRAETIEIALRGGYPEVLAREDPERRRAWFGSYVTTILQRDVRDIAQIDGLVELPRLLAALAVRSSSMLNVAEISRALGLPLTTVKRYMALLENTFMARRVLAWPGNRARRLIKTPRAYVADTGLLGHLAGLTSARVAEDPSLAGPLLESLVAGEIVKQLTWSDTHAELYHFRTHSGREVDLVLERDDGRIVGLEIKAAGSVAEPDFRGLEALRDIAGKRFHRGIVLYTGTETLPFGDTFMAAPIASVWRT